MSRTRHWALGAVIAALCSFVYAKAPNVPHGGGGGGAGYSHAGADRVMRADARIGGRYYGAPAARPAHTPMADRNDRNQRMPSGGMKFADGNYADGFAIYNPGMRRVAGPAGDVRSRAGYAGAITPISAESRAVQRPPPNAPVRSGSIRADVARYNEERGSARAMQRPADDPRQPEGSPYRN